MHDGLITKRLIRCTALAMLRPRPGELLWDLGAGAGSVAVEWCRSDDSMRAVGVERRADRATNARTNAERLTLPGQFDVVESAVGDALPTLPEPDAIFIGGGLDADIAATCLEVLPEHGRLLVHGVTMETEALLVALHAEHGGELSRLHVETGDRVGNLRGWKPARAVVSWYWTALTNAAPASG